MKKESLSVKMENISAEELSFEEIQEIDGGWLPLALGATKLAKGGAIIAGANEVYKFGHGVVDGWKAAGKR
ncbi:class IIb bacteriocin, lactobin A/cerein 7B family [Virgibacillus chiguensis]|uniref:Class IIb bacteriocin, lactobin A/cerein 7B family n=1 Tax=Virgibacillus chiguensis TaxID=411959 RepID=A0A1M5XI95_9BACI|nr:class IIb bacteriocin, lactobin A/cerein 7B family [Virgibacillus chiguensis]SHH99268.1 class IIb bacteriocin, lactobin A/cerein 7B family [Virgibacillus chiguensis]